MEKNINKLFNSMVNDFIHSIAFYGYNKQKSKCLNDLVGFSIYDKKRIQESSVDNEFLIQDLILQLKEIEIKENIDSKKYIESLEIAILALYAVEMEIDTHTQEGMFLVETRENLEKEYLEFCKCEIGIGEKKISLEEKQKENKILGDKKYIILLESIKEELDTCSKIINYINKIFVYDFSTFIFTVMKQFPYDITKEILQNALSYHPSDGKGENIKGSTKKNYNEKNRKMTLLIKFQKHFSFYDNNNDDWETRKKEIEEYLAGEGDVQFWKGVFNEIKKKNIIQLRKNINVNFLECILTKLNEFRNKVSHNGCSRIDSIWVIFTLETIIDFLECTGNIVPSNIVHANFLKKRLLFEKYSTFGSKTGKIFSSYSDLDYSFVSDSSSNFNLPCWSKVIKYNNADPNNVDEIPFSSGLERIAFISNYFFSDKKDSKVVIDSLVRYYNKFAYRFLPGVSSKSFHENLEMGYPFHPMFFVITKGMPLKATLKLAYRSIRKSINSCDDILIPPCDVIPNAVDDYIPEYDKWFIDNFNTIDYDLSPFSPCLDNLEGFHFFQKIETEPGGPIMHEFENYKLAQRIANTILMLNHYDIDSSTRDFIRLCVLPSSFPNSAFEETLDNLVSTSIMIEKKNDKYWYQTLLDYFDMLEIINKTEKEFYEINVEELVSKKAIEVLQTMYPGANIFTYYYSGDLKIKENKQNIILLDRYKTFTDKVEIKQLRDFLNFNSNQIYKLKNFDIDYIIELRMNIIRVLYLEILKKENMELLKQYNKALDFAFKDNRIKENLYRYEIDELHTVII